MCRVIAVSNQKGGVGKTVSCVNLGIGLAQSGKKVLLIDADPQGSMTISLGYPEPDDMEYNLQPNNTNNNNTEYSDTYPILSGDEERMGYEAYLREQLEISVLKSRYPYDSDMIEGILELMLDILCSRRKMIRIAGDDKPANVVKGRFMKLNMGHIEYVMDCVRENTTKVRSIKQYLLAALYNAPATMDGYYRAEVNHDMATGKI